MRVNILSYLNEIVIRDHDLKDNPEEYKRIVLTVNVIMLAAITAIIYGIAESINGFWPFIIVDTIAFLTCIIALYCVRIGKKSLAVDIMMGVFVAAMGINTSMEGRESGNFLLYFPIMASVIFISPRNNPKKMLFWLVTLALMLCVQEIYDYRLFPSHSYPPANLRFTYIINLIASFGITIVLILELVKINEQTEKKLLNLNLSLQKSNDELQKTNGELDSFVYRASHDIRSPISSAKGLITISKSETDIDQIKMYLELQEKSLNKLESFVTTMLNHSRNSRAETVLKPVNFQQIIEEIIQYTFPHSLIASSKHTIQISDDVFYSDPDRIQTVFINLIGNAVKYKDNSKAQFELSVKVACVGSNIEIIIQDNGVGIPDELQPRIFEMFFRATQLSTGSGLGLYIVKEAVGKLEGTITVDSKMAQGTTFTITLPYKKPSGEL